MDTQKLRKYAEGYSDNRVNRLLAKCYRCKYEWIPRVREIKTCPKCRSPYWDKAKNKKEHSKMRIWATGIVQNAKYYGYLGVAKDQKCKDCGKKAQHWEHRNYARPLLVDPVCVKCNHKRGKSSN